MSEQANQVQADAAADEEHRDEKAVADGLQLGAEVRMGGRIAVDQSDDSPYSVGRATDAAWRLTAPLVAQTAGWLVLRLASRLVAEKTSNPVDRTRSETALRPLPIRSRRRALA